MTIRRFLTVTILISANLFFGLLLLETKRPKTLSENNIEWNGHQAESKTLELQFQNSSSGSSDTHQIYNLASLSTRNTNVNGTQMMEHQYQPSQFPYPYRFLIPNDDLCSRTNLKSEGHSNQKFSNRTLLILVTSSLNNFETRQTIRETWGSVASFSNNTGPIRMAFLLGNSGNSSLRSLIRAEYQKHFDLIQQDFLDSYKNLTLKSVMLLKWVSDFCPNVNFVLKTDDDMYVNVNKLIETLSRIPLKSHVMYGKLFRGAKPNRNPSAKWHVPRKEFPGDTFPDYLSGTGYVISRDAVQGLLDAIAKVTFLGMEDIFITGVCANNASIGRLDVLGFTHYKRMPNGCGFKDAITGHHVNSGELRKIWRELQDPKLVCHVKRMSQSKRNSTLRTSG